jgi:rubrerythrin
MSDLKGTKTEKNLLAAFAGESQARNKYTYYASKAKKEGYEQIAAIFEETAANEKEHAKMWFKLLHGDTIPSTIENLKDAAEGENYEWTDMYSKMAEEAREEGFDKIAFLFESVAAIEKEHEERYKKLIENIEGGLVFSRDGDKIWKCRNCGHIVIGKEAPIVCPVCTHPQAYFEIKAENY